LEVVILKTAVITFTICAIILLYIGGAGMGFTGIVLAIIILIPAFFLSCILCLIFAIIGGYAGGKEDYRDTRNYEDQEGSGDTYINIDARSIHFHNHEKEQQPQSRKRNSLPKKKK